MNSNFRRVVAGIIILIAAAFAVRYVRSNRIQSTNSSETSSQSSASSSASSQSTSNKGKKTLIIYFSMSGTTKKAAEQIQSYTNGDIVRLYRAKPYPSGYDNYARAADRERRRNIHPAIRKNIPNLSKYQTIFIGFPTWWQRPPMIIHSLFDQYDFKGKTVVPFTTSMSTPMSASMPTMRQLTSQDGARIKNGFRYNDNDRALKASLNNLGY